MDSDFISDSGLIPEDDEEVVVDAAERDRRYSVWASAQWDDDDDERSDVGDAERDRLYAEWMRAAATLPEGERLFAAAAEDDACFFCWRLPPSASSRRPWPPTLFQSR